MTARHLPAGMSLDIIGAERINTPQGRVAIAQEAARRECGCGCPACVRANDAAFDEWWEDKSTECEPPEWTASPCRGGKSR